MAIQPFLAMTAAEIREKSEISEKIAWMACHFSPYGLGLSNLPRALPPGSLLMVDDITPIHGHDPRIIRDQLYTCAESLQCGGILLDFQRPEVEETAVLVKTLAEGLPCPLAVSHFYADFCTCAVCLPPVPPSEPPKAYFSPWKGRELWLELCPDGEQITVAAEGSSVIPLPHIQTQDTDFFDETLLCHYRQEVREDTVVFTLYRTMEDTALLMKKAKTHGVIKAVGLYQEFGKL